MADKIDSKQKKLCKLVKKELHLRKPEKYLNYLLPPNYICEKCGRIAKEEGLVCKGVRVGNF